MPSMRYHRIIFFLLGIWIGVSAMLAFTVYLDFATVDAILKSPPEQGHKAFSQSGPDNTRAMLHYTAGVQIVNRFTAWEYVQFALGLLITAMLFVESSTRKLAVVSFTMTLLVAFQHFQITPELAWLSRGIEFLTPANASLRVQFWKLHNFYGVVELVRGLLGLGLAVFMYVRQGGRRVRRRRYLSEEDDHAAPTPGRRGREGLRR
jgi:hypothetical protein